MTKKTGNKVVVIGTGAVGVSYAYSMLNQGHCDEMILIDLNRKRAEGEFGGHSVYIGVPAVINRRGAVRIINQPLDDSEAALFAESARLLKGYQLKVDEFLAAKAV